MKRVAALTLSMLLNLSVSSFAAIEEFNQTGLYAERIDAPNTYFPSTTLGLIGGQAANNSLGYAFQFTINNPTRINQIIADVTVYDENAGAEDKVYYQYKLYGDNGTTPDLNALFSTSQLASFSNKTNDNLFFDDAKTPMNSKIQSGTYWLAYERGNGQSMSRASLSSIRFNSIHNPEPATGALLAMGLVPMLLRKRRQRSTPA